MTTVDGHATTLKILTIQVIHILYLSHMLAFRIL
jgi:hypothetical protein